MVAASFIWRGVPKKNAGIGHGSCVPLATSVILFSSDQKKHVRRIHFFFSFGKCTTFRPTLGVWSLIHSSAENGGSIFPMKTTSAHRHISCAFQAQSKPYTCLYGKSGYSLQQIAKDDKLEVAKPRALPRCPTCFATIKYAPFQRGFLEGLYSLKLRVKPQEDWFKRRIPGRRAVSKRGGEFHRHLTH